MKIIWMPRAKTDLNNILDYLNDNWSKREAEKFVIKVSKAIEQIKMSPETFPVVRKKKNIHKFLLVKQNTIYYRIQKNEIELLTIWDTRQNPKKLKLNRE